MIRASDEPTRGLARPPLPHSLHRVNRVKKNDQDTLTLDWDHALQQFAAAVSDDLNDLHARFLSENVVTFAAWKRLWRDARMSASFLVEFWESTPTNTHKTILQQALDGVVSCIEEHGGRFENAIHVAALIGRVFAMYCAYSVQVGSPKHKIDLNPQDGTALLTINYVMSGVGEKLFPIAAREVRAMMHRLVDQENAFLRCLQGFGPRVRVKSRKPRPVAVASHDVSLVAGNASDDSGPIHRSKVEQLKKLNDRYQELISRARAGPLVSGAGARLGLRRAKPGVSAPLISSSLHEETGNNGQDLARALTLYTEYKANEVGRRYDRAARAAAARDKERRKVLEMSDKSSNILDLSDRGSTMSESPSLTARSVTFSRRGSPTTRNGGGNEAVLVELESDLDADISSVHVEPTRETQSARGINGKVTSTFSEISEADSDALADLERELEQSVDVVSRQIQEEAIPEKTLSCERRKRGRHAGIVSRQGTRATASTVTPACTGSTRSAAKRVRSNSVASRLSLTDSWAMSSSADNDELAAIQAELDAVPTLSRSRMAECKSRCTENQQSSSKLRNSASRLPAATPKAKQVARQTLDRACERSTTPIQHDQRELSTDPSRSKALSVVSDSSELIAQLQAELDLSAEPTSSACTTAAVVQVKPRRSSRISSMASETDSNIVEELEKELNATGATLGTVPPPFVPAPAKTIRKRAAQRTCTTRSHAKKLRLNSATVSVVTAARQLPAAQASSKAKGKRDINTSGPTAHQESSRISSVPSDTESDGLAGLVAELDTPASTRVHQKRNSPAKRPSTRPTAQYQSRASSNVGASRSGTVRSEGMPDTVDLRDSARLCSQGSDTESDGLGDLMAELESDPLVVSTKTSKKPRTRVATTRKQPARVQVKSRQNQAKKELKVARAPRAARQPVSKKVAPMPSTRQLPALAVNMSSSRRSTRSSSIAFDSESDGLAELEAELKSGHT